MSSADQKQQACKGLHCQNDVSVIDGRNREMLAQMDSPISPLDLSKQDLPKTPKRKAPIANIACDSQSHEATTRLTYGNNDYRAGSLPKRLLDPYGGLDPSKWRKLIVPTSKYEERADGSFQRNLTPDFVKQYASRTSYLPSNKNNQGGNDPRSSLDYEENASEHPDKLAPSLLPLTKHTEPHVVIAREFLVKIWDWGEELTIEVKKQERV